MEMTTAEALWQYDQERRRYPRCGYCHRIIDDVPKVDLIYESFWFADNNGTHAEWRPVCPECLRRHSNDQN